MRTYISKEEYLGMYNIVGAAMEVYNVLGRGMEEPIYQEALDMEMVERGMIPHREVWLDTFYKGIKLKKQYKADFVVDGVIVELKSVSTFYEKKKILCASIYSYIKNNKSCILDGFINFRISNYLKYINHHLENAVHEFVIHKEYIEYISLLKDYVHEKTPCTGLIHVIYSFQFTPHLFRIYFPSRVVHDSNNKNEIIKS